MTGDEYEFRDIWTQSETRQRGAGVREVRSPFVRCTLLMTCTLRTWIEVCTLDWYPLEYRPDPLNCRLIANGVPVGL